MGCGASKPDGALGDTPVKASKPVKGGKANFKKFPDDVTQKEAAALSARVTEACIAGYPSSPS